LTACGGVVILQLLSFRIKNLVLSILPGIALLLAQNAYAQNYTGYITVTCPQGFTLIAQPLILSPNNNPVYSIDNTTGYYNGCQIFFWQNGIWAKYVANTNPTPPATAIHGWVEPNGPMLLPPGAGAVFYNPNSASVTFGLYGVVPQGSLTNTLHSGLNLVSSIVPLSGDLSANSAMTFPNLAGGQFDGDQVFLPFNSGNGNSGYTTFTVDSLNYNPPANYGWDGLPGQPDPVINIVTEAFWYRAGNGTVQWIENFIIDGVVPSGSVQSATSDAVSSATRIPLDASGSAAMSKSQRFQLTFTGQSGKFHVVQVSSDLKSWKPVGTNLWSSGKFIYTDPVPATNKMRFYRAFALP
jgi:hypothetical protein